MLIWRALGPRGVIAYLIRGVDFGSDLPRLIKSMVKGQPAGVATLKVSYYSVDSSSFFFNAPMSNYSKYTRL